MTQGEHVCCLVSVEGVCGGLIGSGSKFCIRVKGDCDVVSHGRRPFEALKAGYYVKANALEAFTVPYMTFDRLSSEVGAELLRKDFKDISDVMRYFTFAKNSTTSVISSLDELEDRKVELSQALFAKTPAPKERKRQLRSQYEELASKFGDLTLKAENLSEDEGSFEIEGAEDSDTQRFSPKSWTGQFMNYLQTLVNNLSEDRGTLDIVVNQIQELFVQVGVKPDAQREVGPNAVLAVSPSLWVAVANVNDELQALSEKVTNRFKSDDKAKSSVTENEASLSVDLANLTSSVSAGFKQTEHQLEDIRGFDLDPISDPYLNVALCSRAIQNVESGLSSIQKAVDQLANRGGRRSITINVGRHSFSSMEEFGGWVDKYLPPSLPFGMFMDVFSYLQRIKSFRDAATEHDASDMEKRKKLKLTADEDITMNAFNHPLPRLFHGGSSPDTPQSDIWLPGISSAAKWENEDGTNGVKITIEENEQSVNERIEKLIERRLPNHDEARAVAAKCLSSSSNFVTQLNRFISDTHRKLVKAGYDKKRSWQLVSKVVHRLFATDCHIHRGLVNEIKDAEDRRLLAIGLLWSTFCTHEVMKEYVKHGIENHPSVASEYVRFLVANTGHAKVEQLDTKVEKLESTIKSLETRLKAAEKSATTAANRADEAAKLAKNRK